MYTMRCKSRPRGEQNDNVNDGASDAVLLESQIEQSSEYLAGDECNHGRRKTL